MRTPMLLLVQAWVPRTPTMSAPGPGVSARVYMRVRERVRILMDGKTPRRAWYQHNGGDGGAATAGAAIRGFLSKRERECVCVWCVG